MANFGGVFLVAIDVCIPLLQTEQVAYLLLSFLTKVKVTYLSDHLLHTVLSPQILVLCHITLHNFQP
jgi:hypothetical protein